MSSWWRHHGVIRDLDWFATLIHASKHPLIRDALTDAQPSESNLLDAWGVRLDQGQTESCAAHSFVAGLAIATSKAGLPLPWIASPRFLYAASGLLEASSVQDNGRQLVDVIDAAKSSGLVQIEWTSPDAGSDCTPADVCNPPSDQELAAGRQHEVDYGEHAIPVEDPAIDDLIVATLTSSSPAPVWYADLCGPVYQGSDPATACGPDSSGGGHATAIVGHRTRANGDREYLSLTSWGRAWGLDGTRWISSARVRQAWELRPLTVTPPGLLSRLVAEFRAATS